MTEKKKCLLIVLSDFFLFDIYLYKKQVRFSIVTMFLITSLHIQYTNKYAMDKWAIYKPRHWNLGIGIRIGIGTDTTNGIISKSIKPMDTKPSWVEI